MQYLFLSISALIIVLEISMRAVGRRTLRKLQLEENEHVIYWCGSKWLGMVKNAGMIVVTNKGISFRSLAGQPRWNWHFHQGQCEVQGAQQDQHSQCHPHHSSA